jgi:DNA repair photolyase
MAPAPRDSFRWPIEDRDSSGMLFGGFWPERHIGRGEYRGLEFLHVNARTIINSVPAASRMPFRYTINVYRGCSHACTYCFARPTHEFLGLGIGEDFERRIVVKVNAVERARAELSSSRWQGDVIAMGTNTDPYQHAEGKYHLTRGVVGVLSERQNPFSILTKSTLVLRDVALLAEAARRTSVRVNVSIGTLDRDVWRLTEPGTPPPDKRLEVVRRLNEAGVACGVLVAPVLPGLSDADDQVMAVVEACHDAGAVGVNAIALHLRPGVREHYLAWLAGVRPDLVELHAARFQHGSYQPRRQQERLSALVSQVMGSGATAERPARSSPRTALVRAAAATMGPAPEAKVVPPAQLDLFSPA